MGARDYWDRMLVYFGIAEDVEDEDWVDDESGRSSEARGGRRERGSGGGRSAHRGNPAGPGADDWDEPAAAPSHARSRPSRSGPSRQATAAGVSVVVPRSFNDAQQLADHFKRGTPVIANLLTTDADLAKRLIDFASGLTYGLDGAMQRIADKVFLLTPPDVEVSAEERAAMLESGFFNQS